MLAGIGKDRETLCCSFMLFIFSEVTGYSVCMFAKKNYLGNLKMNGSVCCYGSYERVIFWASLFNIAISQLE